MLEISDIVTAYGKIEALKGVSLKVEPGKITCLLGPNGAGKTTLMLTVAGILKPRRGSVRFEGRELAGASPRRIVETGIALVPENRLVFPQMTVEENLSAGAFTRGDRGAIAGDVERMYGRFPRLKERIKQRAGTLSGGEQQMLAIGRAMLARPRLLLLDEPSLGLAPQLVQTIFRIIREINAAGTTIFLVEQNAHMALQVAHRAYVLEVGRVVMQGNAEELAKSDAVRKAYLGIG